MSFYTGHANPITGAHLFGEGVAVGLRQVLDGVLPQVLRRRRLHGPEERVVHLLVDGVVAVELGAPERRGVGGRGGDGAARVQPGAVLDGRVDPQKRGDVQGPVQVHDGGDRPEQGPHPVRQGPVHRVEPQHRHEDRLGHEARDDLRDRGVL